MADDQLSRKTTAEKLGWSVPSSRIAYRSKRFTVREDQVVVPGASKPIEYSYAQRAPGVLIVPVTAEGKIVLLRQYRFPVDEWCCELPAGTTSDTGEMPLEEVVRKELREEIGATAERVEQIAQFLPVPAYCTEICHTFIAWHVRLSREPEPEPTEKIEIELVAPAEALERAEDGRIQNGACALALCQARAALRASGFI